MDEIESWLRKSPFLRDIGMRWNDGELLLDWQESNTGYGVLHGGVIGSLALASAQATAKSVRLRANTVSLHINYARAARGASFTTSATAVRHARGLHFYAIRVRREDGSPIANASATLAVERHSTGTLDQPMPLPGDPAEFNTATRALPFLARRGIWVDGVGDGTLAMTLPSVEHNLDVDGTVHEGAVLTLIDAAGASVPWTHDRPSSSGATIALHASILGPLPSVALAARASVRASDGQVSWCDVSVFNPVDRHLHAIGTVLHRFT